MVNVGLRGFLWEQKSVEHKVTAAILCSVFCSCRSSSKLQSYMTVKPNSGSLSVLVRHWYTDLCLTQRINPNLLSSITA